jgi:hypothetical protein
MVGDSTEIRQQLRNQSLSDLLSGTIRTVGGRVFPDDLARIDLDALNQIVESWRSTHVQTYGNVLPNSGVIQQGIVDGGGIQPENNEVIEIVAISTANSGGGPIDYTVSIGDVALANTGIPPAGGATTTEILGALYPIVLSNGLSLKFTVTNGTGDDFSAQIAYQYRCK